MGLFAQSAKLWERVPLYIYNITFAFVTVYLGTYCSEDQHLGQRAEFTLIAWKYHKRHYKLLMRDISENREYNENQLFAFNEGNGRSEFLQISSVTNPAEVRMLQRSKYWGSDSQYPYSRFLHKNGKY